jgi:hypothetical protein
MVTFRFLARSRFEIVGGRRRKIENQAEVRGTCLAKKELARNRSEPTQPIQHYFKLVLIIVTVPMVAIVAMPVVVPRAIIVAVVPVGSVRTIGVIAVSVPGRIIAITIAWIAEPDSN